MNKKTEYFMIRATHREKDAVAKKARGIGIGVSDLVRYALSRIWSAKLSKDAIAEELITPFDLKKDSK